MALNLTHAVSQILQDRGWLPEADLLKAVHSLDRALASVTGDDLLTMPSGNQVMLLSGDRWVWLPTLLVGKVLTHRVNQREIDNDLLDIRPDLEAITWIASTETGETLQDGSPVTPAIGPGAKEIMAAAGRDPRSWDREGALLLAEGQLSMRGLTDGDLVALGFQPGDTPWNGWS